MIGGYRTESWSGRAPLMATVGWRPPPRPAGHRAPLVRAGAREFLEQFPVSPCRIYGLRQL
ncbi:hypothetical protein GCM10023100_35520 [Actinocorallia cavernae]|uniref:Uncharacterized protein n=2 Tax=Actinomycetes TaxID=1760 RepID=A0ABN3N183_9ACTN